MCAKKEEKRLWRGEKRLTPINSLKNRGRGVPRRTDRARRKARWWGIMRRKIIMEKMVIMMFVELLGKVLIVDPIPGGERSIGGMIRKSRGGTEGPGWSWCRNIRFDATMFGK